MLTLMCYSYHIRELYEIIIIKILFPTQPIVWWYIYTAIIMDCMCGVHKYHVTFKLKIVRGRRKTKLSTAIRGTSRRIISSAWRVVMALGSGRNVVSGR